MAKKLVLVRHGLVDVEFRNRFMGKTDAGLSDDGRKQAAAIAGAVGKLGAAHYLVSPLRRALETARIALDSLGQSFDVVSGLREIDFGAWEGKSFNEISVVDSAAVERWSNFDQDFVFPGGEAVASFEERVRGLAGRIAADPAETVVAVTHGGIIRFLICHYLGLDFRCYLLFDVQPASLSALNLYDQKGVLTRLNDLCHLEGWDGG